MGFNGVYERSYGNEVVMCVEMVEEVGSDKGTWFTDSVNADWKLAVAAEAVQSGSELLTKLVHPPSVFVAILTRCLVLSFMSSYDGKQIRALIERASCWQAEVIRASISMIVDV